MFGQVSGVQWSGLTRLEVVLVIVLYFGAVYLISRHAKRKGQSQALFFIASFFNPILIFIVAFFLKPLPESEAALKK